MCRAQYLDSPLGYLLPPVACLLNMQHTKQSSLLLQMWWALHVRAARAHCMVASGHSMGTGSSGYVCMTLTCLYMRARSLRDMLYRRRMERQLAQARGLAPGPERPPDEDVRTAPLLPSSFLVWSSRGRSWSSRGRSPPEPMLQYMLVYCCMAPGIGGILYESDDFYSLCRRQVCRRRIDFVLACSLAWTCKWTCPDFSVFGVRTERPERAARGGQQAGRVRAAQPARGRRRRRRRQHATARGEQRAGD